MEVEDFDEHNRSNVNQQTYPKMSKGKNQKKGKKKKTGRGHRKPKLKHWELKALEQAKQEPCNCRHHVMRLEANQIVYDWCRCKDHQHKHIIGRQGPTAYRMPLPPVEQKPLKALPPPPSEESTPTSPSTKEQTPLPPPPPPRPKPRKVRKKSIGIDATDTNTTQIALAYDPAAVDYDMVQEVIYYRTSSGRLVKSFLIHIPKFFIIYLDQTGNNQCFYL